MRGVLARITGRPSDRRMLRIAKKYGYHPAMSGVELDEWCERGPLRVTPRELHELKKYGDALDRWAGTPHPKDRHALNLATRPVVKIKP